MEYQLIAGKRRNAVVLWSPGETNLYMKQVERNGKTEFICYQKTLYEQYIKGLEKENKNNNSNSKEKKIGGEKGVKKLNMKSKIGVSKRFDGQNKKTNEKKQIVLKCNARAIVGADGRCTRNKIAHSGHENHEYLYKDIMMKNNIIEKCIAFKDVSKGLSLKIPANDIFTLEMAK